MHRTFLLVQNGSEESSEIEKTVIRVAELFQARIIRVRLRHPEQAIADDSQEFFVWRPALEPEQLEEVDHVDDSTLIVDNVSHAVFSSGHLADLIIVDRDVLAGEDGELSPDEVANLVRRAPRPVWLVQSHWRFPERIAVGYDAGVHAGHALHLAANMAETIGAKLSVLHVNSSGDQTEQRTVLEWAARYCEPYDMESEQVGLQGGAAESIRAFCAEVHCDLLIVGATGLSYLRGLLFGSVASQLIEDCPCSVLVVK